MDQDLFELLFGWCNHEFGLECIFECDKIEIYEVCGDLEMDLCSEGEQ